MRTEFGRERNFCACKTCVENCRHMPGFLIPADLPRMLPADQSPLVWAEANLLASPGAKVIYQGQLMRIPTLVPATKPDGSCIHLKGRNCQIYQVAPFGCAFFSCSSYDPKLSELGLKEIVRDASSGGLYTRLWQHLDRKGLRQLSAEILRNRMSPEPL